MACLAMLKLDYAMFLPEAARQFACLDVSTYGVGHSDSDGAGLRCSARQTTGSPAGTQVAKAVGTSRAFRRIRSRFRWNPVARSKRC